MRLSPIVLVCAAALATLAASQALTPTAQADAAGTNPVLRVSVQSLHSKRTVRGVELTGQIENTGPRTLTYTSVVCIFSDASGKEIGRGDGYLTAGPVAPGQTAGFRALAPAGPMPAFAAVSLQLREAGRTVLVEMPPAQAASRRTTSR